MFWAGGRRLCLDARQANCGSGLFVSLLPYFLLPRSLYCDARRALPKKEGRKPEKSRACKVNFLRSLASCLHFPSESCFTTAQKSLLRHFCLLCDFDFISTTQDAPLPLLPTLCLSVALPLLRRFSYPSVFLISSLTQPQRNPSTENGPARPHHAAFPRG